MYHTGECRTESIVRVCEHERSVRLESGGLHQRADRQHTMLPRYFEMTPHGEQNTLEISNYPQNNTKNTYTPT